MVNVAMLSLMLFSSSVIHLCYCLPTQENDVKIEAELKHQSYRLKKIHNDQYSREKESRIAGQTRIMSDNRESPCGPESAVLTAPSGLIMSPGYDQQSYPNNALCSWLITAPNGTMTATFEELSLEAEASCSYDNVTLYDGSSANSPSLGTFCTFAKTTITSSGSDLLVVFQSDSTFSRGRFSLLYISHLVLPPRSPRSRPTCGTPAIEPSVGLNRIIGGVEARPHSWPWQCFIYAYLNDTLGARCGGTVISKRYILTAAHCFFTRVGRGQYIRLPHIKVACGVHNIVTFLMGRTDPAMQVSTGISSVLHEEFSNGYQDWDIAVIELAKPLTYNDFVQPVCLPQAPVAAGTSCVATGWGVTKGTGDWRVLRQVVQQTISRQDCRDFVSDYFRKIYNVTYYVDYIRPRHFCAGYMDATKGICRGDSGGPIVCKQGDRWYQYGVVNWVLGGCEVTNSPDIYADVVTFLPWIDEKTGIGASARMNFKDGVQPNDEFIEKSARNAPKRARSSSTPQEELHDAEKEFLDLLRRKFPHD